MTSLLLALALSQTQPAVRRNTPLSDDPGMVTRNIPSGTQNVNVVSGGPFITISSDGGLIGTVIAIGPDGGAVQIQGSISATNPSVGPTASAVPAQATLVGGPDSSNLLRAPFVLTTTPDAGDPGLVVRIVGGGGGGGGGGVVTQGTVPWLVAGVDAGAVPVQGTVAVSSVAGTVAISAASLPLPAGAATETTLSTRLAESTFTGRFPAATLLGDALANPTTTGVGSYLLGWEAGSSTWNRVRTSPVNADNEAGHAQGALDTMAHSYFYDGTDWDRFRGTIANGLLVDVSRVQGTVAVTQSGAWTITTTPPANATTNITQFGGNAVVTGTGTSGVGIPRVTVSNDSTVTANAGTGTFATNLSQVAGTTTATGSGVLGAGTQRVVLATDQPRVDINIGKRAANPATSSVSCSTSATNLTPSPLASRTSLLVTNNGTNTIFIGGSGVTTSNGTPLLPGATFSDDVGSQGYFCVVAAGTENARVLEN
jgi:hypothetical protein